MSKILLSSLSQKGEEELVILSQASTQEKVRAEAGKAKFFRLHRLSQGIESITIEKIQPGEYTVKFNGLEMYLSQNHPKTIKKMVYGELLRKCSLTKDDVQVTII